MNLRALPNLNPLLISILSTKPKLQAPRLEPLSISHGDRTIVEATPVMLPKLGPEISGPNGVTLSSEDACE